MHIQARPILRFPIYIDEEKHRLVISDDASTIQFDGIAPGSTAELLVQLTGRLSVKELADRVSFDPDQLLKILTVLEDHHLVTENEPTIYTGAQISGLLSNFYSEWNSTLFSGALWASLAEGRASERVVDGWLIESYHFIRGANARLGYAAANATDRRVQRIFAKHYVEEYDHYKFFAESLKRRKIDSETVDRLGPLPSTRAVINMARHAARTDCLCYAACSGLLESTGSDASRARAFYASVSQHYDKDKTDFVAPMLKHIDLDEGFEHGNVMRDVFEPIPVITASRASQILDAVTLFKDTLRMWFEDIERFYFWNAPFDNRSIRRSYRPAFQYKEEV